VTKGKTGRNDLVTLEVGRDVKGWMYLTVERWLWRLFAEVGCGPLP
jgi:hypothetical protein